MASNVQVGFRNAAYYLLAILLLVPGEAGAMVPRRLHVNMVIWRLGVSHTTGYHTIPYHTIPYHTIPYQTIPYHITRHGLA